MDIGGVKVVVAECPVTDAGELRDTGDKIRDRLTPSVVFLAGKGDSKILFVAMADKDAVAKGIHCGNIIREAAKAAGGGGGGRPDMAQAGGKDVSKLEDALSTAKSVIDSQIGG